MFRIRAQRFLPARIIRAHIPDIHPSRCVSHIDPGSHSSPGRRFSGSRPPVCLHRPCSGPASILYLSCARPAGSCTGSAVRRGTHPPGFSRHAIILPQQACHIPPRRFCGIIDSRHPVQGFSSRIPVFSNRFRLNRLRSFFHSVFRRPGFFLDYPAPSATPEVVVIFFAQMMSSPLIHKDPIPSLLYRNPAFITTLFALLLLKNYNNNGFLL